MEGIKTHSPEFYKEMLRRSISSRKRKAATRVPTLTNEEEDLVKRAFGIDRKICNNRTISIRLKISCKKVRDRLYKATKKIGPDHKWYEIIKRKKGMRPRSPDKLYRKVQKSRPVIFTDVEIPENLRGKYIDLEWNDYGLQYLFWALIGASRINTLPVVCRRPPLLDKFKAALKKRQIKTYDLDEISAIELVLLEDSGNDLRRKNECLSDQGLNTSEEEKTL